MSEEIRLSSKIGQRVNWLVGAFVSHDREHGAYASYATTLDGKDVSFLYGGDNPIANTEYAVFGNATVNITGKLSVQIGVRENLYKNSAYNYNYGGQIVDLFFGGPSPVIHPPVTTNNSAFTWLVNPKYSFLPDAMAYVRISSGYRIGGVNFLTPPEVASGAPLSFGPDRTINYEVGFKGTFLHHALTLDAAAYHIDWEGIQTQENDYVIVDGATIGFGYMTNAGSAKSDGLELSLEAHPAKGLTLTGQASINDAALAKDLPVLTGVYGTRGTRLPYAAPFSGGFTLRQEIPLANNWLGYIGGDLNYISKRLQEFALSAGTPRFVDPAYTMINLQAGLKKRDWLINLYVTNAGNTLTYLGLQTTYTIGTTLQNTDENVPRPRTFGLSVTKTF
jgi:outer membrane receptor protein involved in Fe transport